MSVTQMNRLPWLSKTRGFISDADSNKDVKLSDKNMAIDFNKDVKLNQNDVSVDSNKEVKPNDHNDHNDVCRLQ